LGQIPRPNELSVDRPVDQLTVIFMTVGVASRPPGQPDPGLDLLIDRSVDRGKN